MFKTYRNKFIKFIYLLKHFVIFVTKYMVKKMLECEIETVEPWNKNNK